MHFLYRDEYQNMDNLAKKDLNNIITEGVAWQVFSTLTFGGIFLIGFALALGANPLQIGILSSIPFFANVAQIIGSYFIERYGKKAHLVLITSSIGRLLWIPIIALPLMVADAGKVIWMIMVVFLISSIFNSIAGIGWLSWISSMVPRNVLGKFFSKRTAMMSVTGVIVGLLGGLFLDWKVFGDNGLTAFLILFSIGMVCSMVGVFFLKQIREFAVEGEGVTLKRFVRLIKNPFSDMDFRRLLLFGVSWGFALGLVGPFILVYQLKTLGLSYMTVIALTTLFTFSGVAALRKWGDVVDKYGAKPVIAICAFVVSMYPLFFIFITPHNFLLLVPANILAGIAWGGVDFATAQVLLRTAPQTNRSIYFSTFTAISGMSFAVAPIIGGSLANVFEGMSYSVAFFTFYGMHFLFIISTFARLWATSFVKGIHEPEAVHEDRVISDLRENRLMSVFANFYSITHFSLLIVGASFVFGRNIVARSGKIVGNSISMIGSGSIKTITEMGRLVRLSMRELKASGYGGTMNLLRRLNILDKRIFLLKVTVKNAKDVESAKKTETAVEKVRVEADAILHELEVVPTSTPSPESYMKRILNLVNKIRMRK